MITVVHDGEGLSVREWCCFCDTPTNHWCREKDVAVCEACAQTHTVDQVPTKRDWCQSVRQKLQAQYPHQAWLLPR